MQILGAIVRTMLQELPALQCELQHRNKMKQRKKTYYTQKIPSNLYWA